MDSSSGSDGCPLFAPRERGCSPLGPVPLSLGTSGDFLSGSDKAVPHQHPDGKGHQLRLDIAPADGDVIELRVTDPEHYPGAEQRRSLAAKKRPYTKSRVGAFRA